MAAEARVIIGTSPAIPRIPTAAGADWSNGVALEAIALVLSYVKA